MSSLGEMIVTGAMVGAAAATGGVVADTNQTVVTGDSSASVQVTNVVNGSNSGGTSHTIIERTVNGVTTREETSNSYEPGEPIHQEISVEAVSGGQTVQGSAGSAVKTNSNEAEDESSIVEATTTPETASSTEVASTTNSFVRTIGSYITQTVSKIFSFLSFWN